MAERILFVVEGSRAEGQILKNIGCLFFEDSHIQVAYEAEIYQLGRNLEEDPYLDIFELLKQRSTANSQTLADYRRDDFSQIYLFFDYEAHASTASDDALAEMLERFNNETEHGKLFISYPMVEALKHLNRNDSFESCLVPMTITGATYKPLVHKCTAFQDIRKLTKTDWKFIVEENAKKGNLIVNGVYAIPPGLLEQASILDGQISRYKYHDQIAVLSAFPFFLLAYFGPSGLSY